MESPSTKANSASSPAASDKPPSLREQLARGLIPAAVVGERSMFQLPGGGRLILSARRQAKKLISKTEGLSPRQYRKRRKELMRGQG